MNDPLHAWVDESESRHDLDPGTYILSAAISPRSRLEEHRTAMQRLRQAQPKLHWRDESPARQKKITQTITTLGLTHLVVVRANAPQDHPRRRRAKCLEHLLLQLQDLDIATITLESRGHADDKRDLDTLQGLRGGHVLTQPLRLDHAPGRTEPMLWIPDAVCGAITAARTGNPTYQELLAPQLELIEI